MKRLYFVHYKKKKLFFIIIPISLFVAFFLYLESNYTLSVFSNAETPQALQAGNTNHSSLALTFNISHGNEQLLPILEELKEQETLATFFVSGEWAERHPDELERIAEDHHEIGMLGYEYKSYTEQKTEEIQADMSKAKEAFAKLGYEETYLLRAPNGHLNEEVITIAENQGLKVIHWSVNPNDWKNPGTEKITDHIINNSSNGDIILLHASDSVKQTDKALKATIPQLKDQGLELVTISELITQAETSQEEWNE